jgi:hypothetical protein
VASESARWVAWAFGRGPESSDANRCTHPGCRCVTLCSRVSKGWVQPARLTLVRGGVRSWWRRGCLGVVRFRRSLGVFPLGTRAAWLTDLVANRVTLGDDCFLGFSDRRIFLPQLSVAPRVRRRSPSTRRHQRGGPWHHRRRDRSTRRGARAPHRTRTSNEVVTDRSVARTKPRGDRIGATSLLGTAPPRNVTTPARSVTAPRPKAQRVTPPPATAAR